MVMLILTFHKRNIQKYTNFVGKTDGTGFLSFFPSFKDLKMLTAESYSLHFLLSNAIVITKSA